MTEEKKENSITDKESKLALNTLKIISQSGLTLGDKEIVEAQQEGYKELSTRVLKLYLKEGLKRDEIDLIQALMNQATSIVTNMMLNTVSLSENFALEKFWGKHPEDVTLADIDREMEIPERMKKKNKDK